MPPNSIGDVGRATPNTATQRTQSTEPLQLSAEVKEGVVKKKATCPFIGTAIATGNLPVRGNAQNPTSSIDDVVKLGNLGGGDLGNVLKLFAEGNHAFVKGASGQLDQQADPSQFSLEFPGSQGAHPGHSGILMGDPKMLGAGRFSDEDFSRLTSRATNGYVKRSDIAKFIGENLRMDPQSKVFGLKVAGLLGKDLASFVGATGPALLEKLEHKDTGAHRELLEKLTKITGEDNLVGSAGEFGLLMAFFANKPGAQKVDGEPAISVADLTSMFKDKKFPAGWETWKKTSVDWVINTTALTIEAGKEYLKQEIKADVHSAFHPHDGRPAPAPERWTPPGNMSIGKPAEPRPTKPMTGAEGVRLGVYGTDELRFADLALAAREGKTFPPIALPEAKTPEAKQVAAGLRALEQYRDALLARYGAHLDILEAGATHKGGGAEYDAADAKFSQALKASDAQLQQIAAQAIAAGHVVAPGGAGPSYGPFKDETVGRAILEAMSGAAMGPTGVAVTPGRFAMPYLNPEFASTRAGVTAFGIETMDVLLPAYERAFAKLNAS